MNTKSPLSRSIILGVIFFLTFTVSRFISDHKLTLNGVISGLIGAATGAAVVFLLLKYIIKKNKQS